MPTRLFRGFRTVASVAILFLLASASLHSTSGDEPPVGPPDRSGLPTGKAAAGGAQSAGGDIKDPWVLALIGHCRAVAAQKTNVAAAVRAVPLFDHIGLDVPFTKGNIFRVTDRAGLRIYRQTMVELVSASGEHQDMVDSKFVYGLKKNGQWERLDARQVDSYLAIAIRSAHRVYLIHLKRERVLILPLKKHGS